MQTIIFNSQKGGRGKTNLGAHLGVETERAGQTTTPRSVTVRAQVVPNSCANSPTLCGRLATCAPIVNRRNPHGFQPMRRMPSSDDQADSPPLVRSNDLTELN